MKLGIMQPYFLPYVGYWQLMNAVDKYVVYDDVNYIKQGWINRNRILCNGKPTYINLPIFGASQNKLINDITVNHDEKCKSKVLKTVEQSYKKAPFFSDVFPLIEEIMYFDENNVALFLMNSFRVIGKFLDIQTELILSSELEKDNNLRGEEKVLSICELLGATEYYNAIGGKELYSFDTFQEHGIQLNFLEAKITPYEQQIDHFEPALSILDVMMHNGAKRSREMLSEYEIKRL